MLLLTLSVQDDGTHTVLVTGNVITHIVSKTDSVNKKEGGQTRAVSVFLPVWEWERHRHCLSTHVVALALMATRRYVSSDRQTRNEDGPKSTLTAPPLCSPTTGSTPTPPLPFILPPTLTLPPPPNFKQLAYPLYSSASLRVLFKSSCSHEFSRDSYAREMNSLNPVLTQDSPNYLEWNSA